MKNKTIIIFVLLLLVVAGTVYWLMSKNDDESEENDDESTGYDWSNINFLNPEEEIPDYYNEDYTEPARYSSDLICLCEKSDGTIYNAGGKCKRNEKSLGCVYEDKL